LESLKSIKDQTNMMTHICSCKRNHILSSCSFDSNLDWNLH